MLLSDFVGQISSASGFTPDVIRFLLCTFLNIPLGLLFHALLIRPTSVPRNVVHIASLSIGLFYMVFCFGPWGPIHMFVTSTFVLIAVHFLPKSGRTVFLVWLWALGYLSVMHIYRMYTDYGGYTLDATGPQMVVTIKLTSYVWNIVDGWKNSRNPSQSLPPPASNVSAASTTAVSNASSPSSSTTSASDAQQQPSKPAPRRPTLNSYQLAHLISPEDPPSPLEFYGFIFFYPSILAGPGIEFMDYYRLVNSVELQMVPSWSAQLRATLLKFIQALIFLPLVVAGSMWPNSTMLTAEWISDRFFPLKLFDVWFYAVLARSKYYFAWSFAEIGLVSSAFSYRPATAEKPEHWDAAKNVQALSVECPPDFSYVPRLWNIATHEWLKNHLFFRLPVHRSLGAPIVFLVSAFWHGFYPSYFAAFMCFFFVDMVDRKITAGIAARLGSLPIVGPAVRIIHTATVAWLVAFCGCIFLFLVPSDLWAFLVAIKFAGFAFLLILFVIGLLVPPPKTKAT